MLVDLLLLPVLLEETTEDTLTAGPQHLGGHPRLPGALALAGSGVAALALGGQVLPWEGMIIVEWELWKINSLVSSLLVGVGYSSVR